MPLHSFKLCPIPDSPYYTILMDGQPLQGVTDVKIEASAGCVTRVTLTMVTTDVEMELDACDVVTANQSPYPTLHDLHEALRTQEEEEQWNK